MSEPERRRAMHLLDLVCLIIGFGLASLWVRAFWRAPDVLPVVWLPLIGLLYVWLGLAMSGPIVLLLQRRRAGQASEPGGERHLTGSPPRAEDGSVAVPAGQAYSGTTPEPGAPLRTRAEVAWLAIGAYWIGMTLIVIPSRVHDTPLAFIAVFQIVAALALWVIPRRPILEAGKGGSWTHQAAILVLVTWPLAWVAMIVLSKTLT